MMLFPDPSRKPLIILSNGCRLLVEPISLLQCPKEKGFRLSAQATVSGKDDCHRPPSWPDPFSMDSSAEPSSMLLILIYALISLVTGSPKIFPEGSFFFSASALGFFDPQVPVPHPPPPSSDPFRKSNTIFFGLRSCLKGRHISQFQPT